MDRAILSERTVFVFDGQKKISIEKKKNENMKKDLVDLNSEKW
jgi:hypothetical protein